jgi:hypothetical protein
VKRSSVAVRAAPGLAILLLAASAAAQEPAAPDADEVTSCPRSSDPGSCYWFGPDQPFELVGGDNRLRLLLGGWLAAGYQSRTTPLSTSPGEGLSFNDLPDRFNLTEAWVHMERRAATDERPWDWGFRADFMAGTDASKTQAFGGTGWDTSWNQGDYGEAIPQLYAELAYGDLSVIGGHFYTIIGYESVMAPENFFYSHSLTMFNSEPFTHTGVLARYSVSDDLVLHGGWTAGWNTGFQQVDGGSSWLGGFSYTFRDLVTLTYASTAGNLGLRGSSAYGQSIVLDVNGDRLRSPRAPAGQPRVDTRRGLAQRLLGAIGRLNYVLQSDLLLIGSTGTRQYGINQYLFFGLNDCWKLGGRLEWWSDDGASQLEVSAGVNYFPIANFRIRPEVRYDWGAGFDQVTFAFDAILTF